jgi:hypothetical protein
MAIKKNKKVKRVVSPEDLSHTLYIFMASLCRQGVKKL